MKYIGIRSYISALDLTVRQTLNLSHRTAKEPLTSPQGSCENFFSGVEAPNQDQLLKL
jgi:hypothetical protein